MSRFVIVFAVALLCFTAGKARSEILEMRQTIYGMDCSSCSHPLGIALKRLPGVESVEVSLERGEAEIRLMPGNTLTVEDVQSVIRKGGFETKEVDLSVAGTLVEKDARLAIAVGRETYLIGPESRAAELRKLGPGKAIHAHGRLETNSKRGSAPTFMIDRPVAIDDPKR